MGYYQGPNTSVTLISEEMQYFKKFLREEISRFSRAILSLFRKIRLCPADRFCFSSTELFPQAFSILSLGED